MHEAGYARIDTGTIAYNRVGSGEPLVLSHAGLVDRRMRQSQLAAFSPHYDVVAFDQLGYGGSSSAPSKVRPAETLLRFLDALNIERATLIGASMGGGYSLDAALLAPDRVTALVLICSGVPGYARAYAGGFRAGSLGPRPRYGTRCVRPDVARAGVDRGRTRPADP